MRIRTTCALAMALLVGCGSEPAGEFVVVYAAHDLMFSDPILKTFEQRSGIDVREKCDTEATKTTGLVNALIQMRNRPEADVFWNNEIMNTIRLAEMGLLEPYVPATAAGIPDACRDPGGRWVGFAARARVILYNTDLLSPEDAPRSIFDLTKPEYRGKVAIAKPLFGTTATHVAALFAVLGADRAQQYLLELKANGVKIVDGNAIARNRVMDGEIAICLTDTDDANGAFLKNKPVEMIYPDQDGMGTLVIPNTVMLIKGGPHPEAGKQLVDFLASRQVEARLARLDSAQMPLRPGIPPHSDRFDLARIKAMVVDWSKVAQCLEQSRRYVQETFLR
ncbi:MAG: extracellular solute-binding protein [Planctomycetota bacterium]